MCGDFSFFIWKYLLEGEILGFEVWGFVSIVLCVFGIGRLSRGVTFCFGLCY